MIARLRMKGLPILIVNVHVHRVGRYLAGLESDARIQARVEHSLWRESWLSANRETLLQPALTWGC